MKPKIITGRRFIGFQMCQGIYSVFWAHIFADCMDCDQSIGLVFDSNAESDLCTTEQAEEIFAEKGWRVGKGKRTNCKACLEKEASDGHNNKE